MSETIELKLVPVREMFYNGESNYGIYACDTEEEDKVQFNKYNNFSIKGNCMRLSLQGEYNARLVEKKDKQYGTYYEIQSIYEDIPNDLEKQKSYLRTILTEGQVEAIYNTYPNEDIIELVKTNQFDYKKVKGIGKKIFQKIKDKIIENIEYQQALSFLSDYGIKNNNLIIRLVKHFKSAGLLIEKMKLNPYSIVEIHGIGFKKADAIALQMGYDREGKHRIISAIEYILNQEAGNGHTYTKISKLIDMVEEMIGVSVQLISEQIKETDNVTIVNDRMTLKKLYKAEQYISNNISELINDSIELDIDIAQFIKEQEAEYGIALTDQQKEFFYNVKKYNFSLLVGFAGCVDSETEFFNGKEWKKISEYCEGDRVLQYKDDGTAELVNPIKYHKIKESKMNLIQNQSGSINQCLSDEHTIVYKTPRGKLKQTPFIEFAKKHNEHKRGFLGRFITSFEFNGDGIELSNEEIRVMVMVIADGYFPTTSNKCYVNIKKSSKKKRLERLLSEANIEFKTIATTKGYKKYVFYAPRREKVFTNYWYQCSQGQLKIITEEVVHWDGSVDKLERISFFTHKKESADFVQFAFSSTGSRATILIDDRVGQKYKDSKYIRKTVGYKVSVSKHNTVSLYSRRESNKTKLIKCKNNHGYKYCFTLPSGMWVMRRGDRICVTGNCGKSMLQKLLINMLDQLGMSYKLLAPTGKAAKVLSSYVNRYSETIHRAIGLGEQKNQEAKKVIDEEFVIVDETSMLDVSLCSKLLRKCTNENLRVLFIGDSFQISSISAGNVLHDCIESGIVPVTKLDKVFRQKEGGILDIVTKVRLGEKFVKNDFVGIKTFGNNCVLASVPQDKMVKGYKHFFNKLLDDFDSNDITIVTPTKKSDLGTIEVNRNVQEIVNTPSNNKLEKTYGKEKMTFREGDLVINTKNTYKILNQNEQKVDIVNGDMGIIQKIDTDEEEIIIDFGFDIIPIPFGKLNQILHAWCLTKHKMQGSSSKAIISISDRSHKYQLNANLIYTAWTRPEDYLVIISQAETINYAMKKVANLQRRTFLRDMLVNGG